MFKEFKKSDLRSGMVVEVTRNGVRKVLFLVLNGKLVDEHGYWNLESFDEEMKNTVINGIYISKVYEIKNLYTINTIFESENLTLIWECGKEINWNNVPRETKVLVRNSEDEEWKNRYFYNYNSLKDKYEVTRLKRDFYTGFEPKATDYKYCKLNESVKIKKEWYR